MADRRLPFFFATAALVFAVGCEKPFTLAAGGSGGTGATSTTATSTTGSSSSSAMTGFSVDCGASKCDAPAVCCISKTMGSKHCAAAVLDCATDDIAAACDGAEDCSGKSCCYDAVNNSTTCRANCANDPVVCHDGGECPSNVCASNGYVMVCN